MKCNEMFQKYSRPSQHSATGISGTFRNSQIKVETHLAFFFLGVIFNSCMKIEKFDEKLPTSWKQKTRGLMPKNVPTFIRAFL